MLLQAINRGLGVTRVATSGGRVAAICCDMARDGSARSRGGRSLCIARPAARSASCAWRRPSLDRCACLRSAQPHAQEGFVATPAAAKTDIDLKLAGELAQQLRVYPVR